MKKIRLPIVGLTMLLLFITSCTSSKRLQSEIRSMRTDLFYELTTPIYQGNITHDVYLNFIDYSNLNYETTVKRKSTLVLPLIFVNYIGESFQVTLGERSLNTTFREFLTQALTTECNSSTCFNLLQRTDTINEKGNYILDVKIDSCQTISKIKLDNTSILWFDNEMNYSSYAEIYNDKIRPAYTKLSLDVTLIFNGEIIHHKIYSTEYQQAYGSHSFESTARTNEVCLDNMAQCLSYATKKIVEDVSKELHLIMSNEK